MGSKFQPAAVGVGRPPFAGPRVVRPDRGADRVGVLRDRLGEPHRSLDLDGQHQSLAEKMLAQEMAVSRSTTSAPSVTRWSENIFGNPSGSYSSHPVGQHQRAGARRRDRDDAHQLRQRSDAASYESFANYKQVHGDDHTRDGTQLAREITNIVRRSRRRRARRRCRRLSSTRQQHGRAETHRQHRETA